MKIHWCGLFLLAVCFASPGSLSAQGDAEAKGRAAGGRQTGTSEQRFKGWDKNQDGRVTLDEFTAGTRDAEAVQRDREVFRLIDTDGDGRWTLQEFVNKPVEARFKRADRNGDGELTFDEHKRGKNKPEEIEEAKRSFARMDRNGDLKLTLEEVKRPRQRRPEPPAPATGPQLAVQGPLTLENVVSPGPNLPDEPYREEFSLAAAVRFLDAESLAWQQERQCFACHSNYAFLMARPAVSHDVPAHRQIRQAAEHLATHPRDKQYWVTEAVMVASVLAQNDAATTGKLHPATRFALDRMWTTQREDGGFTWLDDNEPPSEIDDHYGVTMAAIGAGIAPEGYAQTPPAQEGLDKIRSYLRANPPENVHHRAMKMLASLHVDGIMTEEDRGAVVDDLFAIQKPDGGWNLATLGTNWKRADGSPQDYETSDGYGTGFVIYALRTAGVPADDPRIRKGVEWLKTHQRASGRWFTRSMDKDSRHYITHSGTAYAILALTACGETASADGAE